MEVRNEVFPSDPARMQQMLEKGPDGPIFMVNLLKFKEKAHGHCLRLMCFGKPK